MNIGVEMVVVITEVFAVINRIFILRSSFRLQVAVLRVSWELNVVDIGLVRLLAHECHEHCIRMTLGPYAC